jgi:phenylacetic acid degradation operon negative regulatory protein
MSSYEQALEILMQGDRHRVWSLVVTIFGDLAQNQGDEISAQTLGRMTEQMGIKSQALRVALHRLRKDGWIESKRIGRSRSYFLTAFGMQQSALATPRIYGQTSPQSIDWILVTTEATSDNQSDSAALDDPRSFVRLTAHSYLGKRANLPETQHLLVTDLSDTTLPDWAKNQIIPPELNQNYANLFTLLSAAKGALPTKPTAIERAVLRTLLVHSWRRIILRHLDVPEGFYPQDCKAIACRSLVLDLLARLERPALTDFTDA